MIKKLGGGFMFVTLSSLKIARKITYFEGLVEMNTSRQVILKLCFTHSIKTAISAGLVYGFLLLSRYQGLFPKDKVVGG
jgi:hypothetical protein